MSNEIVRTDNHSLVPQYSAVASEEATAIGQVIGDVHIQIGSEDAFNLIQKMLGMQERRSHASEWELLDPTLYNIFVVKNENYDCGHFTIPTKTALKYTDVDICEKFRSLDNELLKMPCIFACRNQEYKTAITPAFLGKLVEITPQGDRIKFQFTAYVHFSQQLINENIKLFNLLSTTERNQLDEEHWCIKKGNLREIVKGIGVTIN